MTVRKLTRHERKAWHGWILKSHGLRNFQAASPVCFEMEYSLYAFELSSTPGLRVWRDRDHDDLLISFEIFPECTTISRLFVASQLFQSSTDRQLKRMEVELQAAAKLGQLWWGTETLKDSPHLTTILQYFPEPNAKDALAGLG
jgi:hypothetical protein